MKNIEIGSGSGQIEATPIAGASWTLLANYAEYVKETVSRGAVPYNFEDWQYCYAI